MRLGAFGRVFQALASVKKGRDAVAASSSSKETLGPRCSAVYVVSTSERQETAIWMLLF